MPRLAYYYSRDTREYLENCQRHVPAGIIIIIVIVVLVVAIFVVVTICVHSGS